MKKLTFLNLGHNKITRIAPQDFYGATRLLVLLLGGNEIVSVDAAAFRNLAAMQVKPQTYKRKHVDSDPPYRHAAGIGACSDCMLVFQMRLCSTLCNPAPVSMRVHRHRCAVVVLLLLATFNL